MMTGIVAVVAAASGARAARLGRPPRIKNQEDANAAATLTAASDHLLKAYQADSDRGRKEMAEMREEIHALKKAVHGVTEVVSELYDHIAALEEILRTASLGDLIPPRPLAAKLAIDRLMEGPVAGYQPDLKFNGKGKAYRR